MPYLIAKAFTNDIHSSLLLYIFIKIVLISSIVTFPYYGGIHLCVSNAFYRI